MTAALSSTAEYSDFIENDPEAPSIETLQEGLQRFLNEDPDKRAEILERLDLDASDVEASKNELETMNTSLWGKAKNAMGKIKEFTKDSLNFVWRHKWKIAIAVLITAAVGVGAYWLWTLAADVTIGASAIPEVVAENAISTAQDAVQSLPTETVQDIGTMGITELAGEAPAVIPSAPEAEAIREQFSTIERYIGATNADKLPLPDGPAIQEGVSAGEALADLLLDE